MAKEGRKYCPKCGTSLKAEDSYCIKCGYSFTGRSKKKSSFTTIIIAIAIILVLWVALRLYLKKPIIPQEISEFVKGFIEGITNKTR